MISEPETFLTFGVLLNGELDLLVCEVTKRIYQQVDEHLKMGSPNPAIRDLERASATIQEQLRIHIGLSNPLSVE